MTAKNTAFTFFLAAAFGLACIIGFDVVATLINSVTH